MLLSCDHDSSCHVIVLSQSLPVRGSVIVMLFVFTTHDNVLLNIGSAVFRSDHDILYVTHIIVLYTLN